MIQSLDRSLSIMEYLAKRNSAGVTEIANAFSIDKSTASRIMSTLMKHDIVYKNVETQKYCLSVGALLFSYRIASNNTIIALSRPILQNLVELTHETAHLCSMHGNRLFVIEQIKSDKNRYMKDPVMPGMTEPFHCSAVGKCILAYMQVSDASRLLENSEISAFTDNTICSSEQIIQQLEHIRKEGYALDNEEYSNKVCCIAVPVFDSYGYAFHSIGLSGESKTMMNPNYFSQSLKYLKDAGEKLSKLYRDYV